MTGVTVLKSPTSAPATAIAASTQTCWPAVGDDAGQICRLWEVEVAVNVWVSRTHESFTDVAVPAPIPPIAVCTFGAPVGTHT